MGIVKWIAGCLIVLGFVSPGFAAQLPPSSFADEAEKLIPAVVNISTTQTIKKGDLDDVPLPQFPPGSPFEDLFKEFMEREQKVPRKVTSLGSGFIVDAKGIIVTNNHVIDQADAVTVILGSGESLPAEVIGRDPKIDVAVLRVKPKKPLAAVKFGNSDKLRVGDWVLAVGNPFGLGGSLSAGVVSARNRNINAGTYDDFIQTDAAINRGNSGGPLFDLEGNVVGVNTAILSPTGGSVGIGFSIPSNLVAPVVAQLLQFGETRRGWLGVRIQGISEEMADALSLNGMKGALVAGVNEGGPAEKAGLKAGDVIVAFDGKEIADMRALPRVVADTAIGRRVKVEYMRDGQLHSADVVVGRLEDAEKMANAPDEKPKQVAAQKPTTTLGLELTPLTGEMRNRYSVPSDVKGVLVVGIDPAGPSADEDLQPGDVIVEVGQEPVAQPKDVVDKVAKAAVGKKKSILLFLNRQGAPLYVAVKPA